MAVTSSMAHDATWLLIPPLATTTTTTTPTTTTTTSFNGLFSRTTWVSRHQKGQPFWILPEQEMMGWQWHHLDHMHIICTSLQTDNHASTSPLSFYRPDALPAAQPTASKHWMQIPPRAKVQEILKSINRCTIAKFYNNSSRKNSIDQSAANSRWPFAAARPPCTPLTDSSHPCQ